MRMLHAFEKQGAKTPRNAVATIEQRGSTACIHNIQYIVYYAEATVSVREVAIRQFRLHLWRTVIWPLNFGKNWIIVWFGSLQEILRRPFFLD